MDKNGLSIYDDDYLKSKIYNIRGKQVMLDFDLAKIYGYETKNFNRQVKNNIERFDDDFRFQLSDDEVTQLSRCKIFTLKNLPTHYESIKIKESEFLMSKILTSKTETRGGRQ